MVAAIAAVVAWQGLVQGLLLRESRTVSTPWTARPALAAEHLTTVLADGTTHTNPGALTGGRFDDILISTMHGHVHRRLDADLHDIAFHANDLHVNSPIDDDAFADFSGEDEHGAWRGLTTV